MAMWRPQHYKRDGQERNVPPGVLANSIATGNLIAGVDPELPPIFSLRHVAHITQVEYGLLRAIVSRNIEDPYKTFRIRKRSTASPGYRVICVPVPGLMTTQRWIAKRILSRGRMHSSSMAYGEGCSIQDAATLHCGARWLIKLDVHRFFESISEIAAYRIFRTLGYQPLVCFELARICTRLGTNTPSRRKHQWRATPSRYARIAAYANFRIGHLPQGAPSSPMLSNLAMVQFDEDVTSIAETYGLVYTRYADDLCLSTSERSFSRQLACNLVKTIYIGMARHGLSPNVAKTRVIPPGARKNVLGLLVDGDQPRLSREFRANLRQHVYYLTRDDIGAAKHAARRGFASVMGLRHHVEGLLAFAEGIDATFAAQHRQRLATVRWPV